MAEFAYKGRSPEGELVTGKLHGGSADARNAADGGAEVSIHLPPAT